MALPQSAQSSRATSHESAVHSTPVPNAAPSGRISPFRIGDEENPSASIAAQTSARPEDPWPRRRVVDGFPETAQFLAADPAKTTVIVRRFDEVAVRNLLYLEGRVAALEFLQYKLDDDDHIKHSGNEPIRRAASSFEDFALLGSSEFEDPKSRRDKDPRIPDVAMEFWKEKRMRRAQALKKRNEETMRLNEDLPDTLKYVVEDSSTWNDLGCGQNSAHLIHQRWDLARAIELALKDYQKAILRYREVATLQEPAKRTELTVRDWAHGQSGDRTKSAIPRQFVQGTVMDTIFGTESQGNVTSSAKESTVGRYLQVPWWALRGFVSGVRHWDPQYFTSWYRQRFRKPQRGPHERHVDDRVGLGLIGARDPLTTLVAKWTFLFKRGKDTTFPYQEIDYVPESYINRWVTRVVLAFAFFFILVAIWALWVLQAFQPHEYARLLVLSGFIVGFGLALLYLTNASRQEAFAATAAYGAVLVVFVSQGPETKKCTTLCTSN